MMMLKVLYRIAKCGKPSDEPVECEQKVFSEVPLTSRMIRQMIVKDHGYSYVVSISSIEPVAGAPPGPTAPVDYRIFKAGSRELIESMVRWAISDGWKLSGNLVVLWVHLQENFYQAMTREAGTVSKGGA